MEAIRVVNSSIEHEAPEGVLEAIISAVELGLHRLAHSYTDYVWRIAHSARAQGFQIVLLDNPDVADALGYHAVDPAGHPYARVFLDPIFDNGGGWLTGPDSVAAVVSHEAFEMPCDPPANRWADNGQGDLFAFESCDPVQATTWEVDVPGHTVSLSDFVTPEWFNPWSVGPFDFCEVLDRPFSLAPGGYAIKGDGQLVFGDVEPEPWRLVGKGSVGSRTWARGHAMPVG